VSAQHGIGSGDLLDVIVERLEALPEDAGAAYVEGEVTVAIVGRPNVGKSSLLNKLIGSERTVVSAVAGTTRDAIDETLLHAGRQITLVDTAGIRKRGKVASGPSADKWATVRSVRALDRADVALLLIDASTGLQAQDLHIAGSVIDAGKGLVLVLNKWDLIEKDGFTFDEIEGKLRRQAPFLDFAPLVSISAVTGLRATKVLDAAVAAADARNLRIPTGVLNRLIAEAVARQEPAHSGSKRPKILYAAQASTPPPTFVVFARNAAQVHFTWQRFLENQIREKYPLMGTPIRIVVREREAEEGRERGRSARSTKRAPAKAKPAARAGAPSAFSAQAHGGLPSHSSGARSRGRVAKHQSSNYLPARPMMRRSCAAPASTRDASPASPCPWQSTSSAPPTPSPRCVPKTPS
jgi:GTP-binding protein